MTATLLLNDKDMHTRLLSQDAAPTEAALREAEPVVGCNCDRWGHPCRSYVHRNVRPNADRPISLPLNK